MRSGDAEQRGRPGLDRASTRGDRRRPRSSACFHTLLPFPFFQRKQGSGPVVWRTTSIVEEGHLVGRLRRHIGPLDLAVLVQFPQLLHGRGDARFDVTLRRILGGRRVGARRRVGAAGRRWRRFARSCQRAIVAATSASLFEARALRAVLSGCHAVGLTVGAGDAGVLRGNSDQPATSGRRGATWKFDPLKARSSLSRTCSTPCSP